MIGLNVGSGQRPFKTTPEVEWWNLDKVSRPGCEPDLTCDGANIPGPDQYADYFVLHHVLEHFGCGEARGLIAEAFRVLKPGGSLLVFVPDMKRLAERYLDGRLNSQLYMTNVYGAYMGHDEDRHKWGFDPDHLFEFLRGSKDWKDVVLFNWRTIEGANIARDWWILGMECIK